LYRYISVERDSTLPAGSGGAYDVLNWLDKEDVRDIREHYFVSMGKHMLPDGHQMVAEMLMEVVMALARKYPCKSALRGAVAEVGLCTQVEFSLPMSLKAPGFNPCTLNVISPGFKTLLSNGSTCIATPRRSRTRKRRRRRGASGRRRHFTPTLWSATRWGCTS
jgi:hypothetical protein